jgi:uncharacterized protein
MKGMNAATGEQLSDMAHLRQSIQDILSTPLGTRVMRRDYGSRLFELVDKPMSPSLVADIQAAVAMALTLQEPRIRLTQVLVQTPSSDKSDFSETASGKLVVSLMGYYLPDGRNLSLEHIAIS